MDYGGDSGGHRGRREAFENIRRNDAAAWRERLEAEAVRTRLEKRAPGGQRANLGRIVAMAAVDSVANRSLESTLSALRRMAQGKMRKAAAERPKVQSEDDARDEEHVPELRAARVRDADGSIRSDARTARDHFAAGDVRPVALPREWETLSIEQMRALAQARVMGRYF